MRTLRSLLALASLVPAVLVAQGPRLGTPSVTYPQLVALFRDWRAFEDPPKLQGAPTTPPPPRPVVSRSLRRGRNSYV